MEEMALSGAIRSLEKRNGEIPGDMFFGESAFCHTVAGVVCEELEKILPRCGCTMDILYDYCCACKVHSAVRRDEFSEARRLFVRLSPKKHDLYKEFVKGIVSKLVCFCTEDEMARILSTMSAVRRKNSAGLGEMIRECVLYYMDYMVTQNAENMMEKSPYMDRTEEK